MTDTTSPPKEKKILRKLYLLITLLAIILAVWNRVDITSMTISFSDRILALEEVIFPEVRIDKDPILGKGEAPITVMIFSDFLSEDSFRFYADIYAPLVREYIQTGEARLVFKNLPLLDESTEFAVIGDCVHQQGKFWKYYPGLFKIFHQNVTQKEEEIDKFIEANLDVEQFKSCIEDPATLELTFQDMLDALRLGVSTPAIFINQKKIIKPISYGEFKLILEELKNETA